MSYPTYDQFVKVEAEEIAKAYRERFGHDLAIPDMAHNCWRRLNERWSHRDIIHDIKGEPLEDGGAGGDKEPPLASHLSLGIDGKFFTLNGQPLTLIECSDFSLFKRFLEGEDIDPVLNQRALLGFNLLRVWLLNTSVVPGGILPRQYPDFYQKLGAFVDRVGLGVELTVFTQTPSLMPDEGEQQRHLDQTAEAVRGKGNVLLELVNENDHVTNGVKDNEVSPKLKRPGGVLISRGSATADAPPPRHDAPWDYECYHTNDLSEWWRKVGHNAMELAEESGKPCLSNENTRYPDKDGNANHAFDAARAAAALCAGSCFHSGAGKLSQLFTGQELVAAAAWASGAKSVPLQFQKGDYHHRPDLESPDVIRVYSKSLSGQDLIIQIRK